MTTLVTPPPAAPESFPEPVGPPPVRVVQISANLLPAEILADRRLAELKKRIVLGLGALAAVLVLAYGLSWWQTSSAQDRLTAAQDSSTALMSQEQQYGPLVSTQGALTSVQQQLATVMGSDLDWGSLLGTLTAKAPRGVVLTGITGSVTSATDSSGTSSTTDPTDVLNQSGQSVVGSLALTGSAPDKASVAAYVDALSGVKGIAAVYPSSVTGAAGGFTFAIDAQLTSPLLGGRFTPTTTAPAPAAPPAPIGGN